MRFSLFYRKFSLKKRRKLRLTRAQYAEHVKFTDDFFFSRLMRDEELCKELIEILLNEKIDRVVFCTTQHSLRREKFTHGIIVDVFLESTGKKIVVELQTAKTPGLPQRTRLYQGMTDTATLPRGKSYKSLKDSYILFLCTFDPFGLGLPVYTVRQCYEEAKDTKYDDGTHKVYYNSTAFERCPNENIKAVLRFMQTNDATSSFTQKAADWLSAEQRTQHLWSDFMTAKMRLIEIREEEYERGEYDNKIATARRALNRNIPCDVIADITGLSLEEIADMERLYDSKNETD